MIIINAENLIVGRLGTFAAKQAMLGEEIRIVNAEKAVISGKKDEVFDNYLNKRSRGTPTKGPFLQRNPDRILRRSI